MLVKRAKNHHEDGLVLEVFFFKDLLNMIGKKPNDIEQINSQTEVVLWSL
jgi:hypothetical protein